METYVIAFESTHAAMATERALACVKTTMLPTPKGISAGCGISLKFSAETDEAAVDIARSSADARGLASLYRQTGGSFDLVAML